jgi:hypothetical protein
MRVAAGVLLIIAAVINLFAGLVYLGGGAAIGLGTKLNAVAAEQSRKEGRELTEADKERFAELSEAKDKMGSTVVRAVMAYGLVLLVTVGTSITGAVFLFRRRSHRFIIVAAALSLAAEVLGCVVIGVIAGGTIGFGKVLLSACGILGGVLALFGARQIAAGAAPPAAPPDAAAAM